MTAKERLSVPRRSPSKRAGGSAGRNKPDLKKINANMRKAQLKPLEPYKSALSKWKCLHIPCGEVVYPKYNWIQQGQGGCRTCRYIKSGNANRMPEIEAIAIMLKAKLQPLVPYTNSATKWLSTCLRCGGSASPTLSDIQGGHGGCLPCGYKATADKTRMSSKKAAEVMVGAGYKPLEPYKNSSSPWKCMCNKCGKVSHPILSATQFQKSRCTYCAGNKMDAKDAVKIMRSAKLRPLEPYVDSKSPWKCQCLRCENIVSPTFGGVSSGQGGCSSCGKKAGGDKNRTSQESAIQFMLEAKLKPLEPYKNRHTPWKSQCLKCGAIVKPMLGTVLSGSGCISCTPFGINLEKPSYLYLITNFDFNAHKVGIGNIKRTDDRLGKFIKRGWQAHKVWQTETGAEALRIEKEVFKIIRKEMKLPIFLSKDDMPVTGGHSETVDADSISLVELEKIIKAVIKVNKPHSSGH